MAVSNEDLARLIVTLDVDITRMYNGLKKAQQQTNTAANGIEKRLTAMSSNIDRTFANLGQRMSASLTGPLAGIGAAFSVREIVRYADAWTVAANKVAAAGDIVGIQARPLSQLRELADQGRSSFEDTIQLYSRMLRAAGGVANGELEIAKATDIVNKAFKAGGAATSEMQAGILQLSQGLSSGVLQGDELRSVRENAPVLAQVMADYFNTTIGGLKELGSQGKLTSDLVFKAILSGEAQIESAFGKTNRTIAESFQLVQNRLIEYIGTADQTVGATATITQALTALADNFDEVADVALKLAAILAGALIGRSILGMIGAVGNSIIVLKTLSSVLKEATSGVGKFGVVMSAAFGPLALIIGGIAALAFQELSSQSIEAAANINALTLRADTLGVQSIETAKSIRDAASALALQTEKTNELAEAERRRNLISTKQGLDDLKRGTTLDTLTQGFTSNEDLKSAAAVLTRAKAEAVGFFNSETDRLAYASLSQLAAQFINSSKPTKQLIEDLRNLQSSPIGLGASDDVISLLDTLDGILVKAEQFEGLLDFDVDTTEIDAATGKVIELLEQLSLAAQQNADFEYKEGVDDLIKKLEEGQGVTQDTLNHLERLTATNGDFNDLLSGINSAISEVIRLGVAAINAKAAVDALTNTSDPAADRAQFRDADYASLAPIEAGNAFVQAQRDLLSKTQEERDLVEEIARVRKEMGESAYLSENEISEIAAARIAQKAADKEANKTGSSNSEKFFENLAEEELKNEYLREEVALRQSLNPLINDYGFALEKAKKEQELLIAAEKAGVPITEQVRNRIEQIAEVYATLTAEVEKTTEAQDKLKETTQEWADFTKQATRSFIDDLIEGKTAAEAFGNVLQQIGSKLIDMGLESLFGGGGGDFGLFGKLFNLPGRAGGGPVTAGRPYIVGEKRPEVFVPNQSGVIIPKVPSSMGSSGGINTPISISIDATGADAAGLARLQAEIVKLKAELPYAIKGQVSQRTKKGW